MMEHNNNSTSRNGSEDAGGHFKFVMAYHLPITILVVLIVLMNTFVILLFALKRTLRKPHNYLLCSLSVSDLLTGLIGLPLVLVCTTTPACVVCIFSYHFVLLTSISTLLHILLISYERYFKIVFPLRYQGIGTMSFELKVIAVLWITNLVVPFISFSWYPVTEQACLNYDEEDVAKKTKIYTIFVVTMFVALPLLLLIFADVSVFFVVRRHLEGIDATTVGLRDSQTRMKKERRVVAIMAVMMAYFVICWSFYYAGIIMFSVLDTELDIPDWIHTAAEVFRCSTPLFNPILYVLLKQDFRNAIWIVIQRLKRKSTGQKSDLGARLTNDVPTVGQTNSQNVTEKTTFF